MEYREVALGGAAGVSSPYRRAPHKVRLWGALHKRAYLIWKVREAKAGRVPVGPAKGRVHHGPTIAVTIQFDEDLLAELDATAAGDGFPKRLPYLRDLIRRGLEVRGHATLAARFA